MRRSLELNISSIERYSTITEDGLVWSKIKDRWLKPHDNIYGYIFYSISRGVSKPVTVFAHTLVALKYCSSGWRPGLEVDHKDCNKANNHWSNLQWVTHSYNILKTYRDGRVHYWKDKTRTPFTTEQRMKMADAKKKRILFSIDGIDTVFGSIEEASVGLGTYRKRIYLCLKDNKTFGGGVLSVVDDIFTDKETP